MSFPLLDILGIGAKLLDKFIPDPQAKAAAQLKLTEMAHNGELAALAADTDLAKGQLDINKKEAENPSLFVSGWRPGTGWICNVALLYQFLIRPALVAFGKPAPALDMGDLLFLLGALLGIGGMRTKEKLSGVARK